MAPVLMCIAMLLVICPTVVWSRERRGRNDTIYVAFSGAWTASFSAAKDSACGFILGLETVKEMALLPGYKLEYQARDMRCNPRTGMQTVIDMRSSMEGMDVVFIDACSVVCQPIALLAAAWNIPSISAGCTSDALSDTDIYPTFARVTGGYMKFIPVMSKVAKNFNFTNVAILTVTEELYKLTAEYGKKYFESQGQVAVYKAFSTTVDLVNGQERPNMNRIDELKTIIRDMKHKARFFILLMYTIDIRHLLILANEEGMLNGEYLFYGTDMRPSYSDSHVWRPELTDDYLFQGYISMDVSFDFSSTYQEFLNRCFTAFQDPLFDPFEKPSRLEHITINAAMIHDAVVMWALAVNNTISEGSLPDDGVDMTANIINSSFHGVTGSVIIDERGDRSTNYLVEMVQNRRRVPILEWRAQEQKLVKRFKPDDLDDWSGILWPGNGTEVPRNSPLCGWNGELCVERGINLGVVIGPSLAVICVIALVILILWRKMVHEAKLKEAMTYVLAWKDIHVKTTLDGTKSHISLQSYQSAEITAVQSIEKAGVQGHIAAVKRIGNCSVDVTDRQILNDLKNMKDAKHDNINAFLGVCLEVPNCCILMQFAQRESLHDILTLKDFQLTWDFKLSIVNDIASGMRYLHSSEIGYHGHLTSKNCVLDSRWICKITDYGLRFLKSLSQPLQEEQKQNPESLLWTAPEILRGSDVIGSKKADVYSFGVIVQEVTLEGPAYCQNDPEPSPDEIIERVKSQEQPPFRPHVDKDYTDKNWTSLMTESWHEVESERPSFGKILSVIKELNNGKTFSLVDNMITHLEHHTKNLEDIVFERTEALHEEKLKVEQLLLELLPRSIADKLKVGIQIKPESFESTTIFFSDVVSFTRISAAGTPIDVVKMLNWMYTMFDDVSANFDVYKVATIGDAYFVASGVPIRNGDNHAAEICGMAVQLLKCMNDFYIPHIPNETLKLRIGVHSGSCVAGVAGIKMPRYLLFGDTIDIASRLESQGESMRIHVSQTTADLLTVPGKTGGFSLENRGRSEIKGLGYVYTYWLNDVSS